MNFKKLNVFTLMAVLSVSSLSVSVMAQDSAVVPEDKTEVLTHKLVEFLSLTSEQANEVRRINLKFIQSDLEAKSALKGEATQLKKEREVIEGQYDKDILNILDEEQKRVYRESITKRKAERAEKASIKADN